MPLNHPEQNPEGFIRIAECSVSTARSEELERAGPSSSRPLRMLLASLRLPMRA